jgi:hypothetical protein
MRSELRLALAMTVLTMLGGSAFAAGSFRRQMRYLSSGGAWR